MIWGDDMDERRTAAVFKALGDENRIRILKLLCTGEKCACHLLEALEISQPTLSHHMKILCDAELVTGRREGKWMHYSINCDGACHARTLLTQITSADSIPAPCKCE